MYRYGIFFLLIGALLLTSGCWSKHELVELGFVLGVALDAAKDNQIEMTAQIYRPGSGSRGEKLSSVPSTVNVKAKNKNIMAAVRDIPMHLGRKSQWSHMQVILVSEKLARSQDIGKLLDFFYRDHEARGDVQVLITGGRADAALMLRPRIEKSTSQELLRANRISQSVSGKTLVTTLLQLGIQARNAHVDGYISYLYKVKPKQEVFSNAGIALTKNGKMVGVLSAGKTQGLAMLRDEFKSGIIGFPCPGKKQRTESLEVLKQKTKLTVEWTAGKPSSVTAHTDVEAAISELKCSYVRTPEEEKKLLKAAESQLKQIMQASYHELQKQKIEAVGISNLIYRKYPRAWAVIKDDWDYQFTKLPLHVNVKMKLTTPGASNTIPLL
ncbi:Ger(x)C family spore germination protein [Paenibacillus sp. P96]|uniref:Ger(X)C family spore germination protein n=1 Tax=Paenibacillus zeirhizosphaerae TaxID=2987519 RepID=A0ABT9FQV4_9BACL|nr:Ger(x)C family spore germination protein [Paenibacillus sp. P96]MDP4097114.1 Ger(x)C family spore germination protein [Paenibacillus sp. P96]